MHERCCTLHLDHAPVELRLRSEDRAQLSKQLILCEAIARVGDRLLDSRQDRPKASVKDLSGLELRGRQPLLTIEVIL
jgi:hypothetical protein